MEAGSTSPGAQACSRRLRGVGKSWVGVGRQVLCVVSAHTSNLASFWKQHLENSSSGLISKYGNYKDLAILAAQNVLERELIGLMMPLHYFLQISVFKMCTFSSPFLFLPIFLGGSKREGSLIFIGRADTRIWNETFLRCV